MAEACWRTSWGLTAFLLGAPTVAGGAAESGAWAPDEGRDAIGLEVTKTVMGPGGMAAVVEAGIWSTAGTLVTDLVGLGLRVCFEVTAGLGFGLGLMVDLGLL